MLDTHGRKYIAPVIDGAARGLLKLRLNANQVTFGALVFGILAGVLIFHGQVVFALLSLWFSGFLDAVDGSMARMSKTSSPWGTVLDITYDRIAETGVILGLAFRYPEAMWAMLLLTSAIIISMTVFLTVGAVAEKKGVKSFYYQVGLAERTEGFIMLSAMMLFSNYLALLTLIFAGMVIFTAAQRFMEARRILE